MRKNKIALNFTSEQSLNELAFRYLDKEQISQYLSLNRLQRILKAVEIFQLNFGESGNPFLTGIFNMNDTTMIFGERFDQSSFARSSLIYLQSFAHLQLPSTYFWTRENLGSFLLVETLSGQGYLFYEGHEFDVYPGDIFILDCRKKHHYRAEAEGWEYRLLHFDGTVLQAFYAVMLETNHFFFPADDNAELRGIVQEIFSLYSQPTANRELLTHGYFTHMFTQILIGCPTRKVLPKWTSSVCRYIEDNIGQDLSLDFLAGYANVSKFYLSHAFKEATGQSVLQFITAQRIRVAEQLLRFTESPIYDISTLVGFENASSFGKVFKKMKGITPREYRQKTSLFVPDTNKHGQNSIDSQGSLIEKL